MFESWFVPLWDSLPRSALALGLGAAAAAASAPALRRGLAICGAPPRERTWISALGTGCTVGLFAWLFLQYHVQRIDEVRPGPVWDRLRVVYHGALIVLLAVATATDWKTCFIPNEIPEIGLAIGLSLAVISGDLQLTHAWVDWNEAVPHLSGPLLPAWMDAHRHLHGLVWSAAGAACGAAMMLTVRLLSRWALGVQAVGAGDIWLMAMIGSFLGWQATIVSFLLAPPLALAIGLPLRIVSGRPYIPYGPFLSVAAYIVLCTWKWIWTLEWSLGSALSRDDRRSVFSVRRLFGDPPALLSIAACILIALTIMLGWKRWQSGWTVSRPARESTPQDRKTTPRGDR